jgi:hypothetical protein
MVGSSEWKPQMNYTRRRHTSDRVNASTNQLINEWWELVLVNILFNHGWYGWYGCRSEGEVGEDILVEKVISLRLESVLPTPHLDDKMTFMHVTSSHVRVNKSIWHFVTALSD